MQGQIGRILVIAVFVFAAAASSAAHVVHRVPFERTYDRSGLLLEPVKVDGVEHQRVILRSASSMTTDVGQPALPVDDVTVLLPPDADDVRIETIQADSEQVWSSGRVMPVPPDVVLGTGLPEIARPPRSSGREIAEVIGLAERYGARVAVIRLAPFVVRGSELRLNNRIRVSVAYRSRSAPAGLYRDLPRAQRDALAREIVNKQALNDVLTLRAGPHAGAGSTFIVHSQEPAKQEQIPYVIVTPSALAASFQPLLDWRTSTGDAGKIVTTEWIAANYAGVDGANRIRNFIADAVGRWNTSWVLLGGDTDQVSYRAGYYDGVTSSYGPTDLYYSGQSGIWNDDGNAVFGDFTVDASDIDPDLFIGRAPVSTSQEAATFVQKVLTYEKAPPLYIESALLMGVSGLGSDGYKQNTIRPILPATYQTAALYDQYSPYLSFATATLNSTTAINEIDQGYHVINHMDHSGIDSMGTGASEGGGSIVSADAAAFTNGTRASIVWTYGCDPNAYDYESISESWMTNPNGGAVAFVGNTRTGWSGQLVQDKPFFDAWFVHGDGRIGAIFNRTQGASYGQYYSAAMNLLGDPAMPVWIRQPAALGVSGIASLQTGTNTINLAVANLPGGKEATVTFRKDDDGILVTRSTTGGALSETLTLHSAGTLQIAVRGADRLPSEGSYPVTASGAHVHVDVVQVDDTAGNGDQKLEPGEQAMLRLQMRNGGSATSAPASATLASSSTGAAISTTTAAIPAIAPSGTTTIAFPIALANTFADGDAIDLDLAIGTATTRVVVPVFAARLEQTHRFTEVTGNGDGVPDPGETVELHLHAINNGFGDAAGVTATLTATTSAVTIVNGTASAGTVAAKSAVDVASAFKLTLGSSFSAASDPVLLTLTDSLGNTTTQSIELRVPAVPANLRTRGNTSSIRVIWDPPSDPLSRNYRIYRGPSGGPYASLETFLLRDASTYTDLTASGNQTYTYAVTIVDAFGNESAEATVEALPSLDQHPDFPRSILSSDGSITGAIATFDVDGDGEKEIFALTSQSQTGPGALYAWRADGNELISLLDPNFAEFALLDGGGVGVPAFADIDNDHQTDIIVNGLYRIYAFKRDGSPVAGWANGIPIPAFANPNCPGSPTVYATSPVVADLDGDKQPEIITTSFDWQQYCDGSNAHVYVFKGDGTLLGQHVFSQANYSFGAPAVADLDGNGNQEAVIANHTGQPIVGEIYVLDTPGTLTKIVAAPGALFRNEPSLADLDGDDALDVIVGSTSDHRIYAFRLDGTPVNGWQGGVPLDPGDVSVDLFAFSTANAVEDLDCDQSRDVVVLGQQKVYVFEHDGLRKSGWPVARDGSVGVVTSTASPLIADVDGDADLDVVVASKNTLDEGTVEAWDGATGTPVPHFPVVIDEPIMHTPAVTDLESDGRAELVAAGRKRLYVWTTAGFAGRGLDLWPQLLRDSRHTSTSPIVKVNRSYLTTDRLFCQTASFTCLPYSRPFSDACGCGCIPSPNPPWWEQYPRHDDRPAH